MAKGETVANAVGETSPPGVDLGQDRIIQRSVSLPLTAQIPRPLTALRRARAALLHDDTACLGVQQARDIVTVGEWSYLLCTGPDHRPWCSLAFQSPVAASAALCDACAEAEHGAARLRRLLGRVL